ncbi:MAG: hypothetical protein ACI3VY_02180 [Faecousia sp.]
MKVRDLIEQSIDIDVYDDVCEELGIAFCGPLKLTEEGEKEFSEALDYEVELNSNYAIVSVDAPEGEWQKRLKKAKKFFYAAAGYCDADDYDRWFKEEE